MSRIKHLNLFSASSLIISLVVLFIATNLSSQSNENSGKEQLAAELASQAFIYPLMDARLTSKFGKRKHPIHQVKRHHNGLDLAAESETPIRAIREGVVIFADTYKGYGKLIVVKHTGGYSSHYGHCKAIQVDPGKKVKAGEIIATVGSTGLATGPHLHFEIRANGKPQDPLKYFPGLLKPALG